MCISRSFHPTHISERPPSSWFMHVHIRQSLFGRQWEMNWEGHGCESRNYCRRDEECLNRDRWKCVRHKCFVSAVHAIGGSKRSGVSKWLWVARVSPIRNVASSISWRQDDRLAVDQAARMDFRRVSLLLTVFWSCQYCVHDCVRRRRRKMWLGRIELVPNISQLSEMLGLVLPPDLSSQDPDESDFFLGVLVRLWRNMCIRCTSGWSEWMLWMACRDDRESERMRNGRFIGRFRRLTIVARQKNIAWSSSVKMEAKSQWRAASIWVSMEYAKFVFILHFDPSVKHRTGIVNWLVISEIWDRKITGGGVEDFRKLVRSKLHLGGTCNQKGISEIIVGRRL